MESIYSQLSFEYASLVIIAGFGGYCLNAIVSQQYKLALMIDKMSAENNLLLTQNDITRTEKMIEETHNKIVKLRHKINDLEDGKAIECFEMDDNEEYIEELITNLRQKESNATDVLIELQDNLANLEDNKVDYFTAIDEFNRDKATILILENTIKKQKKLIKLLQQANYDNNISDIDSSDNED